MELTHGDILDSLNPEEMPKGWLFNLVNSRGLSMETGTTATAVLKDFKRCLDDGDVYGALGLVQILPDLCEMRRDLAQWVSNAVTVVTSSVRLMPEQRTQLEGALLEILAQRTEVRCEKGAGEWRLEGATLSALQRLNFYGLASFNVGLV